MTEIVALGDAIDAVSSTGFIPWGITVIGNEIFVSQYNVTTYRIRVFDADAYTVKREFNVSGVTANQYGSIGTDGTNLMVSNSSECIVTIDKETGAVIKIGTISYGFSLTATFDVDLERDLIVFQTYSGGMVYITRYSTGVVLNTYRMPITTSGSGAIIYRKKGISKAHIVVSQYFNNMIFVSSDISKSTENLTFTQIYTYNTARLTGLGARDNQLFVGVYSPGSKIFRLDISKLTANQFLISAEDKYYSVRSESYSQDTVIPAMTSNVTPLGKAFSSSEYSTDRGAWRSFDKTQTTYASRDGAGMTGHLGYEFNIAITIGKYSVQSATGDSSTLQALSKDWTFEGSDDGVNWNVLDTQTNQAWTTAYTDKEYYIDKSKIGKHKMYRLNWSATNGWRYAIVGELKMYQYTSSLVREFPHASDVNFIKYGMNKNDAIDLNSSISHIQNVVEDVQSLGSGKLFRQPIDRSKHQANKIILG
ncbi:hypothetical protein MHI48_09525 [Paenibacillus sp. FSL H7-0942]|uniref:F5/8 type C domain-containing protein n=1 Tax=Paenibacillus amylolyticus TaxID=1451 RepID=A0ABD8AY39_PAEAM